MSKVRVYELAKETGLPNPEVIRRLGELGVEAKSHSSTIEDADAARFRGSLGQLREQRRKVAEERAKKEAEEYDVAALQAGAVPKDSTARRILPPHLRKAQSAAPAAAGTPPGGPTPATTAPPRFRPAVTPFRPDGDSGGVSVGGEAADAAAEAQPTPDALAAADPSATAPAPAQAAPGAAPVTPAAAAATPVAPVADTTAAAAAPPSTPQAPAGPAPAPAATSPHAPAAASPTPTATPTGTARPAQARPGGPPQRTAAEAARAGLVRPAGTPEPAPARHAAAPAARASQAGQPAARTDEAPRGIPGVPRPGTPPRPGQPTVPRPPLSPAATGIPVQPRRRVEHQLPQEGSGKRFIPPPLRPAPKRSAEQPAARSGAPRPGGAGRPGGAAPGRGPGTGGPPSTTAPGAPADAPGGAPGRGKKGRKDKRRKDPTLQEQFEATSHPRGRRNGPVRATVSGPVDVLPGVTVSEFAKLIGVNATDIVRVLFGMGEMITVTQSMSLDLIELVGAEMEAEVNFVTPEEMEFGVDEEEDEADLVPRAPVVTVMGHVDHGKTLLLDAIREADVVSGEAGGITQHIGAYQVLKDGRAITFIDTPGHEAFTQMRARGASVTDVAILVVAADDGVKPQTVEAINHIKAADVPIIVAVNKIDKEGSDPVRVRTQLTEYDLVAEEFGGQTTMVNVSAKTRQHLEDLLEMVLLQADIAELKANPNRKARGAVIEAHLDRGRGAVATVLVQAGTLRIGDNLVAGIADCKVRAMFNDAGEPIDTAGPSTPVQVLGWNEVPDAGDECRVVEDERTARDIAENRQSRNRRMELAERRTLSLDQLGQAIEEGQLQTLNLIVKGDVAGSVEALSDAMNKLELPEVRVNILHKGVGAVNENDVNLAATSDAIIIAFNVRPEASARAAITASGVDLRQYSIIYKATEDISNAVRGLLAPEFQEVVTGRAEVREVFRVPRAGFVFGCLVTEGALRRNATMRVIRDSVVVAEDTIASLRRFKDDATEVAAGYECGAGLEKFQDVKAGDEFEVYEQREVART